MAQTSTDCRSEEGVTVGLIDSLIVICRVLAARDLCKSEAVKEALKDFASDEDFIAVIDSANSAAGGFDPRWERVA